MLKYCKKFYATNKNATPNQGIQADAGRAEAGDAKRSAMILESGRSPVLEW
jgi:hypothetical protein